MNYLYVILAWNPIHSDLHPSGGSCAASIRVLLCWCTVKAQHAHTSRVIDLPQAIDTGTMKVIMKECDQTADMKHVTAAGICMQLSAGSVCRHQSGVLHGCGQRRYVSPCRDENILRFCQSIYLRLRCFTTRHEGDFTVTPAAVGLKQMSWNLIIYNHVCVTHLIFYVNVPF